VRGRFLRGLVSAVLVSVALALPASALDPHRQLSQYVHDAWSARHGMTHNSVRCVAQDARGYLWIGNRKGLLRFDGLTFTPFAVEPNDVLTVAPSRSGGVWVGTSRPGHLYLIRDDVIVESYALPETKVEKVYEDEAGVWLGTSNGLHLLENGRIERIALDEIAFPELYAIVGDGARGLWLGGKEGLFHFAEGRTRRYTSRDGLIADDVHALLRDASGTVWVGTGRGGLTRVRDGALRTFKVSTDVPFGTVFALTEDRDGNLWVGTKKGLLRFREGRFTAQASSIGDGQIEDVFLDRENSLWVSTQDRGLHRLRDGAITAYGSDEGLPERIWAVRREGASLWLGTDDGLVHWSETSGRIAHHPLRDCDDGEGRVRAMIRDSHGTLWYGTKGRVLRWPPGQAGPSEVLSLREPLGCEIVESFVEDRQGALWIAVRARGIVRMHDGAITRFTTADGLPSDDMRALHIGRDGTLWAGTVSGLARYERGRFRREGGDEFIDTMYEDREGALWVGTLEQGLMRLHHGRWLRLRQEEGLPTNTIFTMIEGAPGQLWVMCERGVYRLDVAQFEAAAERRGTLAPPRLYGESDGMRSLAAFGSRDPGVMKTADGRLWFGTPNGLAVIDPSRLRINDKAPPVVIESVLRNGQPVDVRTAGDFPAGAASYEFRYTALSLVAPDRAEFRYKLDGIDPDWVDAGGRRSAFYAKLPPGEYHFWLRARNEDGASSGEKMLYVFHQKPFFHQTRAFYALCATGLVLFGAGISVLRLRRMAAREQQLRCLVEERTRQLDRARRQLEESNRDLERRVEEGVARLREAERMAAYGQMVAAVAHEVRHPIFALQAAAYVVSDHLGGAGVLSSQLRTLESETRRLNTLMTELLDFAKPAALERRPVPAVALFAEALSTFRAEGHDVRVDIDVAPDTPPGRIDHFRIVQALLNLMRNAVLHATGLTRLTLSAGVVRRDAESLLRLSVRDDGAGVSAAQLERIFEPFVTGGKGTGLGLAIVRRLVAAHGGLAHAESALGRGTVFHLDFPLDVSDTSIAEEPAPASLS
jgi:ligand-binding sensor domain-containing protein/signal transduction histidine kinase